MKHRIQWGNLWYEVYDIDEWHLRKFFNTKHDTKPNHISLRHKCGIIINKRNKITCHLCGKSPSKATEMLLRLQLNL